MEAHSRCVCVQFSSPLSLVFLVQQQHSSYGTPRRCFSFPIFYLGFVAFFYRFFFCLFTSCAFSSSSYSLLFHAGQPPLVFLPFACLPPPCVVLLFLFLRRFCLRQDFLLVEQGAGDRSVSCGVSEPIACVSIGRSRWLMNLPSPRPRVSRPAAGSPRVLACVPRNLPPIPSSN